MFVYVCSLFQFICWNRQRYDAAMETRKETAHMYGLYQQYPLQPRKTNSGTSNSATIESSTKLVGYILTPRSFDSPADGENRLRNQALRVGLRLSVVECELGMASNPFRMGLWKALRRLVCNRCEPKRMPLSMINFDDFLHQALTPCNCGYSESDGGIVVERLDHVSNDRKRLDSFILALTKRKKHVVAEDGICLSCCHPITKKVLEI